MNGIYEPLSHPVALTGFLFTLILPVLVGFLTLRKTHNTTDFFLGGRAMDRLVVALSAVSSGRSSWLILGVSGMAYVQGAPAVWAIVGYTLAEAVQFVTIGKRLRRETEAMRSITLLDYFESRFRDTGHRLRITGGLIIGLFITAYVAAQLNAGAKSLSTALDLPFFVSLSLSALLILVYMILGGFIAVAYNDVIRAVIMIVGLVILPAVGILRLGGWETVGRLLKAWNPKALDPLALGFGAWIGFVGIGLGSPGQPHILVRYMAIDDPRHLEASALIATGWNLVMGLGAVMIGLVGRALIPDVHSLPDQNPEMVYILLSATYFGPLLYGLLVGGIFAAILSTADSQLLVAASTFVRDLYEKLWRGDHPMTDTRRLMLSRLVVFLSGLLALVLASLARDLIFWLVLFAWGGLGASIGPPLIFSLYWKRTTAWGVVAGMITGTAVTILWRLGLKPTTGLYELVPAFFASALMVWGLSLVTRPRKGYSMSLRDSMRHGAG